jgi:hypothetical protein
MGLWLAIQLPLVSFFCSPPSVPFHLSPLLHKGIQITMKGLKPEQRLAWHASLYSLAVDHQDDMIFNSTFTVVAGRNLYFHRVVNGCFCDISAAPILQRSWVLDVLSQ